MQRISRLNALIESLSSSSRKVSKIMIHRGAGRKLEEIIRLAKTQHIPLHFVPKRRLDRMNTKHQGAIAFLTEKEYTPLGSIIASSKNPFLVLLDGIEDPQNLGAIIRTAEGAGVDGIVLPERRAVDLTDTVSTVSAGAIEHVKVARVKNLARTIDDLKKREIWIVGAEGDRKEYWYEFDYTLSVGIVLGSEWKGLRPLISKKCDKILSLPLLGRITSLNVAAAASIFMYEVVRQRNENLK